MLRVTGGEDAYYSAYSSPNRWHFNPQGPFKWRVNSAGWVYVAKPAVLKVLGEKRFGWREYRVEKDGMIKQVGFKDFTTKEEAEKAFLSLNSQFNVGDRCIHTDIVGHMDKCIVTKADKPGRYTVEFYLGGEKEVAESSLRKLTNAVRNGYVPLRTKSGGVERVYDGDRVIYKGKEFTAEKLGSPSLAQGILVGDDGEKVTVSLKDPDLFATNAVCACNANIEKAVNYTKWDGKTDMRGSSYDKTAPLWATHHSRAKVLHSYSVPSKYIESGELLEVYGWENNGDIYVYVPSRGPVKISKGDYEIYNARACNSTNPIVRKAMNAVAKNYKPTSEFEVGDTVRFKDSVRSVPHDETYKVVKVYPLVGRIIIKSNDGKTSDEFVNDLEIV